MDFFVNPWYMAAGGALISSPILIHLINRMRFRRVRWAAMEFLLKSQKRNRRRLIIEQLILLLLRILLVLLAAFLLARYLIAGSQDQQGTKHVVVLDDSLSMSDRWREGGKSVNSFEKAREELVRVAQNAAQANSAQEMEVYLLSDLENPIFNQRLNSSSIAELQQVLDKQKPTALHLPAYEAVEKGYELLRGVPQSQKILHVLSDFRDTDWVSGPEGEKTMKAVDKLVESGVNLSLLDTAHPSRVETKQIASSHDNLAVVSMRAETRIAPEGLPVEFTVVLKNYSNSDRKTFLHVKVEGVDNFEASKPTEAVPALGTREEKFTLIFSKKKPAATFQEGEPLAERQQKRRAEREFIHLSAELDPEETGLSGDNIRDLVIEVRKKVPALVVVDGKDSDARAPGGDVFHLETAFAAARALDRAYDVELRSVEELDKVDFDLYPCIYFLNVGTIKNEAVIPKLADYVKNGGSVAYFLGPKVNSSFYNEILHRQQKGLFPVLLARNPTEPLSEEEKAARAKEPEPKILFRAKPRADRDKIPPSDPESVVARLVPNQGAFRFLSIDRYHPAASRNLWETDPEEPVHELIMLPNRKGLDGGGYKSRAQALTGRAVELAKEVADKDESFGKYLPALERYRREVTLAMSPLSDGREPPLLNLAAAFERMLNDTAVENDPNRPDMKDLWSQTAMQPLAKDIANFIEDVRYGDPLVVARNYGKGRVVACLTTAGTSSKWNDWGGGSLASFSYMMFIVPLQNYLTSQGAELTHTVGEPIRFQKEASKYKPVVSIRELHQPAPDARFEEGKTGGRPPETNAREQPMKEISRADGNLLEFKIDNVREPGVYRFEFKPLAGEQTETETVAFNVDAAAESDLRRAPREKLERTAANADGKRGKIVLHSMGDDLSEFKNRQPDASESPWLYLLILLVLIVEQALAVHLSFHLKGNEAAPPAAVGVRPAAAA